MTDTGNTSSSNSATQPDDGDTGADAGQAGDGGGAGAQSGKTYSEEQVNRMIDRRLRQERGKYADYGDLQERSKRLTELEESQKTNEEKLRGERDKAVRDRDNANARVTETLVRSAIIAEASKLGAVDPYAVAALLPREGIEIDGEKIEGVTEAVKQLLIEKPYLKQTAAPRGGSEIAGGGTAPRSFRRSQLRDPKFYRENEQAILEAAKTGRILND